MATESKDVVTTDGVFESRVIPPITIHIPMPPGAVSPAEASDPHRSDPSQARKN